jgi:hypothetical protein
MSVEPVSDENVGTSELVRKETSTLYVCDVVQGAPPEQKTGVMAPPPNTAEDN